MGGKLGCSFCIFMIYEVQILVRLKERKEKARKGGRKDDTKKGEVSQSARAEKDVIAKVFSSSYLSCVVSYLKRCYSLL